MKQSRDLRMDADAFLDWAMNQPGRHELHNGLVVAMSPERVAHTRTKYAAHGALARAIAAARLGCEALGDGVTVRIDAHTLYEPDASVRCGPATPGDAVEIDDPVVVVEVLSPSSRNLDTGAKLSGYLRLPALRHYLILQTEDRSVIHHHRKEDGEIVTRILQDGLLALDPPGIAVAVSDLFPA